MLINNIGYLIINLRTTASQFSDEMDTLKKDMTK